MAVDVEQNTAYEARALGRLAQQYQGAPVLSAILGIFAAQGQALEEAFFSILLGYRLSTPPIGAQLDVLGRIVGQDREASTDAEYLLRIAARRAANRSSGSPEDLYTVFTILLPSETFTMTTRYPAGFTLDALEAIDHDLVPLYRQFFDDTKHGGVLGQFTYSESDPAHTFYLSSQIDTLETSALLGLADAAQTTGGHLAGVFQ